MEGRVHLVAAVAAVVHTYLIVTEVDSNCEDFRTVAHSAAGNGAGSGVARPEADEDTERRARAGRGERLVETGVAVVVVEMGGLHAAAPHEPQSRGLWRGNGAADHEERESD